MTPSLTAPSVICAVMPPKSVSLAQLRLFTAKSTHRLWLPEQIALGWSCLKGNSLTLSLTPTHFLSSPWKISAILFKSIPSFPSTSTTFLKRSSLPSGSFYAHHLLTASSFLRTALSPIPAPASRATAHSNPRKPSSNTSVEVSLHRAPVSELPPAQPPQPLCLPRHSKTHLTGI